jgi:hypothetical protein
MADWRVICSCGTDGYLVPADAPGNRPKEMSHPLVPARSGSRHSRLHPAFAWVFPRTYSFRLLVPDEITGQVGDDGTVHAAEHFILDIAL